MAGSWKDRAVPVEAPKGGSSWRDRAVPVDVPRGNEEPEQMGMLDSAGVSLENALTFGTRPILKGAGRAIDQAIQELMAEKNKGNRINAAMEAIPRGYEEGRSRASQQQTQAFEQHPIISSAASGLGAIGAGAVMPAGLLAQSAIGGGQQLAESIAEKRDPISTGLHTAAGAILPTAFSGAGKLLSKGGEMIAENAPKITGYLKGALKPNAQVIEQAAERLGTKPTQGMISDNPVVQGLESSLEQSPTYFGSQVRKQTGPVREALSKQAEDITSARSGMGPFEAGTEVKKGLMSRVSEKLDPAVAQFDAIADEVSQVGLNPKSKEKLIGRLGSLEEIRTGGSEGESVLNEVSKRLNGVKTVKELQKVTSDLGKDAAALYETNPTKARILSKVQDRFRSFENRSIIESGKEAGGEELAKGLIKDVKGARKAYRGAAQEAENIAGTFGGKKGKTVPMTVKNIDEANTAEQLFKSAMNTNDTAKLQKIQSEFPDQFEVLKGAKMEELYNKATKDGVFRPEVFMSDVKKIPESARKVIFGENAGKIKDIQSLIEARPEMIGPSGTPKGMKYKEFFSPAQNAQDYLQYKAWKEGGLSDKQIQDLIRRGGKMQKAGTALQGVGKGLITGRPGLDASMRDE